MKLRKRRCVLALAAAGAAAFALTAAAELAPAAFEFGPEFEYYQYREPGVMKEHGGLLGGYMSFRALLGTSLDARMFGSAVGGEIQYEGSTWAGSSLEIDTPNWLLNFRPTLGVVMGGQSGVLIIPYAGVALRWLQDDLSRNYAGGYIRQNTYVYVPLGMEMRSEVGDWTFGISGEVDVLVVGKNRNQDIPIGSSKYNATLTQTSGFGLQGCAYAKVKASPSFELSIEPFVSYWDLSKSDTKTLDTSQGNVEIYEPENNTLVIGCRLGLGW